MDEKKREQQREASRRWRANHPDRAKQVERDAYHRRQAKLGLESAERQKKTDEEIAERARAYQREWRKKWLLNPENVAKAKEAQRKHYVATADKQKEKARAWYRKNTRRARKNATARYKRVHYGLTPEQYDALPKICGLCGATETNGKKRALHVDHCHDTGKVRGMLCGGCNVGIGQLKHDPVLLRKAADYCERHAASGAVE